MELSEFIWKAKTKKLWNLKNYNKWRDSNGMYESTFSFTFKVL